jgi:hypothetical protein
MNAADAGPLWPKPFQAMPNEPHMGSSSTACEIARTQTSVGRVFWRDLAAFVTDALVLGLPWFPPDEVRR